MILIVSSLLNARNSSEAFQGVFGEPVVACSELLEAASQLAERQFSAVILDQLLCETNVDATDDLLKQLGSAVPVYVNFAINGIPRIVRELRFALQRRKRELAIIRKEAEQALRHELRDRITAMLISCELTLRTPNLPADAEAKMQEVRALARDFSTRLGTTI
jgi:hypothetical protein